MDPHPGRRRSRQPRGRRARHRRRRLLDAQLPDGARGPGAVDGGAPGRCLVPDGRGRQEGRFPGGPAARRGDRDVEGAVERPRATRGGRAGRPPLAAPDAVLAARPPRQAHAAGGLAAAGRPAQGESNDPRDRPQGMEDGAPPAGRRRGRRSLRPGAPRGGPRATRPEHGPHQAHGRLRREHDPRRRVPQVARVDRPGRRAPAKERPVRGRTGVAMIRRTTPAAIAVIAVAIGCGGPPARAPSPGQGHLGAEFSRAFEADAIGEPAEATRRYLEVVDAAAGADGDPWQLPALAASLDALLTRRMSALGAAMDDASLGSRTVQGPAIEAALRRSAANARGAFARGLVARTLATRAQRRGDGVGAAADRAASGCVAQALLIGPTSWAPITGVDEAGPLDRADARIAASYPSGDAFAHDIVPVPVSGYGCAIPLSAASTRPGVRDVAIDLTIPTAQTVG